MANDQRSADIGQKRPTSAPRSATVKDIPTIVLDERKEPAAATALISANSGTTSSGPTRSNRDANGSEREPNFNRSQTTHLGSHMPVRSSSDVGLPAASMPNLTLSQMGDGGTHENHLEVFCSPRTFRRSVDLEISSKEHGRSQYEWVDSLDSSSNCLKVLTASSRVGSSLSLNSECTARSIGLLSNDSDSDNDLSLSEAEKNNSAKQSQLRRFMSYPEEGAGPELCTRSSQSLINLKSADDKVNAFDTPLSSAASINVSSEVDRSDLDKISSQQAKLKKHPEQDQSSACSAPSDHLVHTGGCAHREGLSREVIIGGGRNTHMLSYRCDANDSTRDLRIRQWLQDMDTENPQ